MGGRVPGICPGLSSGCTPTAIPRPPGPGRLGWDTVLPVGEPLADACCAPTGPTCAIEARGTPEEHRRHGHVTGGFVEGPRPAPASACRSTGPRGRCRPCLPHPAPGRVADEEMFRVFNMGIGMILILSPTSGPRPGGAPGPWSSPGRGLAVAGRGFSSSAVHGGRCDPHRDPGLRVWPTSRPSSTPSAGPARRRVALWSRTAGSTASTRQRRRSAFRWRRPGAARTPTTPPA